MDQRKIISRRTMLKLGGFSALLVGAGSVLGHSVKEMCELTPKQPTGPFYPVFDQLDKNSDLTFVDGSPHMARGTLLYLSGHVSDQYCAPVEHAMVEIWQACESGRYNHPGDTDSQSPLDPNFQYWGIAVTNAEGAYSFKTIIPGHYQAAPQWVRPPHIHFKVQKLGFRELITQMYFANNRYNEMDRILRDVPRSQWESVVRNLSERPTENNRPTFATTFDIAIHKII